MDTLALHVTGAAELPAVATNVRNARRDLPDAVVRVIVQGGLVARLAHADAAAEDAEAVAAMVATEGVRVDACANSLRAHHLHGEDLLAGVGTVSSAMGELARLQWAGAAYIRLG